MSQPLRILLIAAALAWSGHIGMEAAAEPAAAPSAARQPIPLEQVKWDKILPELGEGSPEIAILRIEPATGHPALDPDAKGHPRAQALALGE